MDITSTATGRHRFTASVRTHCQTTDPVRSNPYAGLVMAIIKQSLRDLRDTKTSALERDRLLVWFLGSCESDRSDCEGMGLTFSDCTTSLGIDHEAAQNAIESVINKLVAGQRVAI